MGALKLYKEREAHPWVWYRRLDRRSGSLRWGSVGKPFNRRRFGHWLIALWSLWREGKF